MGWGNEDRLGVVGGGLRQAVLFIALAVAAAVAGYVFLTLFG